MCILCVCYPSMYCGEVGCLFQVYLNCSSRQCLHAARTERVVQRSWLSFAAFGSRSCKGVAESETPRPAAQEQMERWEAARRRSGPYRTSTRKTPVYQNAERSGKVKRSVLQTCDRLHVKIHLHEHFYLRVWRNFQFAFDFARFGFKLLRWILRSCEIIFKGERCSGSALVLR